ncbi:hypothetical protein [Sodalis glossinidius]|uniref:hypothetical protein n=1 Tax=Sodalis glossinidius TaxID=63612 RepID=UPI0005A49406|nr:hypothetical protein [Sodalis glossinidius]
MNGVFGLDLKNQSLLDIRRGGVKPQKCVEPLGIDITGNTTAIYTEGRKHPLFRFNAATGAAKVHADAINRDAKTVWQAASNNDFLCHD